VVGDVRDDPSTRGHHRSHAGEVREDVPIGDRDLGPRPES